MNAFVLGFQALLLCMTTQSSLQAQAMLTNERPQDKPMPSGVNRIKGSRLGETFLLPVALHGPNNQVIGLKEGLVIARMLGRTAILSDIYDHYSQLAHVHDPVRNTTSTVWSYFPFQNIFDVQDVSKFTPVVGVKELQKSGWNGQVDALLYWDSSDWKGKQSICRLQASNISIANAAHLRMVGIEVCNIDHAEALRTRLEKYRVVGVLIFDRLVDGGRHASLSLVNTSMSRADVRCFRLFCTATRRMSKAPLLRKIADSFINKYLGRGVPYVAVHIRPYPDKCMKQWQRGKLSDQALKTVCSNPRLHQQIGIQSQMATMRLQQHTQRVFVAAHPHAHGIINASFALEGITPVYLTSQYVLNAMKYAGHATGHISLTLQLFIEEEIAMRSAIFVGTEASSISGVIRQERSLHGIPADRSLVFD